MSIPHWRAAMEQEYHALMKNKTWTLVPPPSRVNIIDSKWVFKVKKHADGSIERYKARLVAKGFKQRQGLDYEDTFSPVVKPTTIRLLLSLAVSRGWSLRQLDVQNAFLHGLLEEEVYKRQPPGFVDHTQPYHLCHLTKAIYGLKQAPRAWHARLASALRTHGFIPSTADTSLFLFQRPSVTMYLLVYVDDIVLVSSSPTAADALVTALGRDFAVKDLGQLHFFLGIEVAQQSRGSLALTQKYSLDLLRRASMLKCKPSPTPMSSTDTLSAADGALLSPEDATMFHARTKHIEIDYHFVRERVAQKLLQVRFISSKDQLADIFTKPLPSPMFEVYRRNLNLLDTSGSLGLYANKLQGELPLDIGAPLPEIIVFTLGQNMLEGHIPASLGNASGLELIDLSSNSFVGEIPTFGKLLNLEYLNLGHSILESSESQRWESLYGLTNCSNLFMLSLDNNQLLGAIPDLVGKLSTHLISLHLSGNNLSRIVPSSLANLTSIIDLDLSNNSLTGTIEGWLGSLKNLQSLDLHGNNFVGFIPPSFGNLSELTILSLAQNEFKGHIPSTLGKLSQLSRLDLSYNNLQGDIRPEISELKQLIALYLSSSRLSGKIPDDLGKCQGLVTIQMDHNNLTGVIPTSLGNLLSLEMLNLSYNDLSGVIPTVLSDLQLLSKLDLSYNRLQGAIPRNGVFEHPANVSLDGNQGLCGRATGFHVPSCPDASPRTGRHYRLIMVLIPIIGFLSLALLTCFIIHEKIPQATFSLFPSLGEKFPRVSYWDLARATGNFSEINLIGEGSYSSVYKGKLKQVKTEIAVKILDLEIPGAEGSFALECKALRGIRHRNIVPLITECSAIDKKGNNFRALIYAFMPNGNLDTWLHHQGNQAARKHLGLAQRISIATNIADALDYLHHDSRRPIIHCDLKPSNILLDIHINACLGDFGIARFYVDSKLRTVGDSSSIAANGTLGYMAPGI
uniref:non-specific serine/threonine protein kinase n=1 Tax=Aegilops tauschii TaxID=37682 RepID=R7WG48_AEGTA